MAKQKSKQPGGSTKAATINKTEGVRQALIHLGSDAANNDILVYLKKRFGFQMTMDHLYVVKSAIRRQEGAGKKAASKPAVKAVATLVSAPRAQTEPAPAAPTTPEKASTPQPAPALGIIKRDALRQALKALGKNAQPLAIQGFLKKHYDLDLTREHISKYKADIRREQGGKKAKVKPVPVSKIEHKKAASEPEVKAAPASPEKGNNGKGIQLEDIEAVKSLMSRIGAEQFRKLMELLGQ